jgi:pimeloyl-ACP methyl ester carboxylesterase
MTTTHTADAGAMSTIVTIPCFSGAPWELDKLTPLASWPLRTMALPDGGDSIETYADYVTEQVADLEAYVLVGDSFGGVVALAVAVRQPSGLRGLVVSGGFAANPVTSRLGRAKIGAARFLPGQMYRHLTLRLHAAALASPFDIEGDYPLSERDTADLFRDHTPWRSYTARAKAAFSADYRSQLASIDVPTLILTPSTTPSSAKTPPAFSDAASGTPWSTSSQGPGTCSASPTRSPTAGTSPSSCRAWCRR